MTNIVTTQKQITNLSEGYIMRPATLNDLEKTVALMNACSNKDYGRDEHKATEVRIKWTEPGFDLEKMTRVIETPEGQIVGYAEIWDGRTPPVNSWTWARVHPDYENRGLGTALRTWLDNRARECVAKCPPEARVVYYAHTKDNDEPTIALFESFGMKHIRYTWRMSIEMENAPPKPALPEGISIETYQHPDELETLFHAIQDAFQDHFGYVPRDPETAIPEWLHWTENDPGFDAKWWFLAKDKASGEIAGVSLCQWEFTENPDYGYVLTLGVRRPWRRQGLGLALLHHTFGQYWRHGKPNVSLHVDAGSLTGATRLYKRAGMHPDRVKAVYEKELRPGVELYTTVAGAD